MNFTPKEYSYLQIYQSKSIIYYMYLCGARQLLSHTYYVPLSVKIKRIVILPKHKQTSGSSDMNDNTHL
jgi:hypothetical protein